MKSTHIKKLTLSAMFIALGFVLPFLTGQIQQIGNMLLPMHIPVLLCGLLCGWQYGFSIGLILPVMRSLILGMPPLYPIAIAMAVELSTYGLLVGMLYNHSRWQCLFSLYRSLLLAMLGGRIMWGLAELLLLGIKGGAFTWSAFISGALLNAIPGIVIQLTLIPAVMLALNKTGLVKFGKRKVDAKEANE